MILLVVFFFNAPPTTEIYTYCHTLSLHAALPIGSFRRAPCRPGRAPVRLSAFRSAWAAHERPNIPPAAAGPDTGRNPISTDAWHLSSLVPIPGRRTGEIGRAHV